MLQTVPPRTRAERILKWAAAAYRGQIVLACSFGGPAGLVLVDLIARGGHAIPVYYLDTGLLFAETYDLIERVRERYAIEPIAVRPQLDLTAQGERYGQALWTRDPDTCCALRKVAPQRAFLRDYAAWITGLRRAGSVARAQAAYVEWDSQAGGLAKVSPLVDWTDAEIWTYVRENDVPYNRLHDANYPSIGCTPCTRAVAPGEDARAGRWADFQKTECGLHAKTPATEALA